MADRVEVELGFTKSMGDGTYEFLRVDIRQGYELKEGEDLESVRKHLNEITGAIYSNVEVELVNRVKELDAALGNKASKSKIHAKD